MATAWGINDQKSNETELHGYEWNHLVRCANNQTQAALETQGPGVVRGLEVEMSGPTTVVVSEGLALASSTLLGYVALKSLEQVVDLGDSEEFPDLEPDGDNYLFATIIEGGVLDDPDSRESGYVQWELQPDDSLDGGVLLARIAMVAGTISEIEDLREFTDLAAIINRVTQLEIEVGELTERVEILETGGGEEPGGGGGETGPIYLAQTKWSEADRRSTPVVLEEKFAALKAELLLLIQEGGEFPADSRLDLYAHRQAVLIHKAGEENPEHTLDFEGAYIQRGLFGEGSGGTENHLVLTTMTPTDRGWTP